MRRHKFGWLMAAVLCFLLAVPAAAAEEGSLRIVTEASAEVCLQYVAGLDGTLTEDFSNAGISQSSMLDSKALVKNAAALHFYGVENQITGQVCTTDGDGNARFTGLEEGYYLVYCTEDGVFEPFLVSIPTVINDKAIYQVEAEPKSSEEAPADPTTPVTPENPEGNIPQTGTSIWPKYLLLAVGVAAIGFGMADVVRGRKEAYE